MNRVAREAPKYVPQLLNMVDCLIYTHENGCPWDKATTFYTAQEEHLDCLKYAIDNGCLLDEKVYEFIDYIRDPNLISYLRSISLHDIKLH